MKRYFIVLAAACALLLALAASPAFAGGGLLGGNSQEQSTTNSTDQSNQAGAINVPILSGNNVAVLSEGDQSNSAGTSQNQINANGTSQEADQSQNADPSQNQTTSNSTDQDNSAGAINVPIASGNNVAVLSEGDQSNSAGTSQNQANVNGTSQQADQSQGGSDRSNGCDEGSQQGGSQDQSTSNQTEQDNSAGAINVPIASGNNVAILSEGDQSNSAGVEQNQLNANATKQDADQSGSSKHDSRDWKGDNKQSDGSGQDESVRNSTDQENSVGAINVPIASGNNVAILSDGRQSNSAGVEQNQANLNVTKQEASQREGGKDSNQDPSLRNSTDQENEAGAVNVPILSGNNVAVLSEGRQSNSAGVEQNQANLNWTDQKASQDGASSWKKDDRNRSGGQDESLRNRTDQENEAWAVNVPILSGNNVAVLSEGRQSNSAGVEQNQANLNWTEQEARQSGSGSGGQEQSLRNRTKQENEAWALNVPILSGNNVAFLSEGRQSNSAGVEQNQANLNWTKQEASQSGSSRHDYGKEGRSGGQEQSLRNRTSQENEAWAFNVPILSGNNVAFLSHGRQSNSAGVEQNQVNVNYTKQKARQNGSWSKHVYERRSRCDGGRNSGQEQSLRNRTSQENEAWAFNVPILSGNNVAFLSHGRQSNSAGVEQNQANLNWTKQEACQTAR